MRRDRPPLLLPIMRQRQSRQESRVYVCARVDGVGCRVSTGRQAGASSNSSASRARIASLSPSSAPRRAGERVYGVPDFQIPVGISGLAAVPASPSAGAATPSGGSGVCTCLRARVALCVWLGATPTPSWLHRGRAVGIRYCGAVVNGRRGRRAPAPAPTMAVTVAVLPRRRGGAGEREVPATSTAASASRASEARPARLAEAGPLAATRAAARRQRRRLRRVRARRPRHHHHRRRRRGGRVRRVRATRSKAGNR